jgi:hypothetical protein
LEQQWSRAPLHRAALVTFSEKRRQQPLGFFEQSTGCAIVGATIASTTSPKPTINAMANSSFRIEALTG